MSRVACSLRKNDSFPDRFFAGVALGSVQVMSPIINRYVSPSSVEVKECARRAYSGNSTPSMPPVWIPFIRGEGRGTASSRWFGF